MLAREGFVFVSVSKNIIWEGNWSCVDRKLRRRPASMTKIILLLVFTEGHSHFLQIWPAACLTSPQQRGTGTNVLAWNLWYTSVRHSYTQGPTFRVVKASQGNTQKELMSRFFSAVSTQPWHLVWADVSAFYVAVKPFTQLFAKQSWNRSYCFEVT